VFVVLAATDSAREAIGAHLPVRGDNYILAHRKTARYVPASGGMTHRIGFACVLTFPDAVISVAAQRSNMKHNAAI